MTSKPCGCSQHCSNRCGVECCGVNAPWCQCYCHKKAYARRRVIEVKALPTPGVAGRRANIRLVSLLAPAKAGKKKRQRKRAPAEHTNDPLFKLISEHFKGEKIRPLDGIAMTLVAALTATGAGRDPRTDIELIRSGAHSRDSLFRECVRQSDPRTRTGWSEYTFCVNVYASRGDVKHR